MDEKEQVQPVLRQELEDKLLPGPSVFVARGFFYIVLLAIVLLSVWASLTEMDVVARAQGRLVVQGSPVKMGAHESAMVLEVPVQIGQHVEKGDVIYRLDELAHRMNIAKADDQIASLLAERKRHTETASRNSGAVKSLKQQLDLARKSETLIAEQAARFKKLADENVISSLEAQGKQKELLDAQSQAARLEADLNRYETEIEQSRMLASDAQDKADALGRERGMMTESMGRATVVAPVAGVITELAVDHPGSQLRGDVPAAVIAPDNKPLQAKVRIPNSSMRRLQLRMPVRLNFPAYPYQDYGMLDGELVGISPDVDAGGFYEAWISLPKTSIIGPRGPERLRAGLDVDAQIIIERQSIMHILLSPLRKLSRDRSVSG